MIRAFGKDARAELHELWARMLFTVLVTNTDDHLKNHGFIYAGDGLWRLSPVFDVNPQPERHRLLKTAVMEGEPFAASLDLVLAAAEFFDLSGAEAATRARGMATLISTSWKEEVRRQGRRRRGSTGARSGIRARGDGEGAVNLKPLHTRRRCGAPACRGRPEVVSREQSATAGQDHRSRRSRSVDDGERTQRPV